MKEMILKVGPFKILLDTDKNVENLIQKYKPFISEEKDFHYKVKVLEGEDLFLGQGDGILNYEERLLEAGKVIFSNFFAGYYKSDGDLKLVLMKNLDATVRENSLENYLRWVTSKILMDNSGFLLHSCGVVKNGKATLLFGSSGDGKTTISDFSKRKGAKILSDDLNIVIKEKDRFFAYSTPFYGFMAQGEKDRGKYEIERVVRLRKSIETRLEKVSKAMAVALIMAHCHFVSDLERNYRLKDVVLDLLRCVDCYELYFEKNDSFWDLI